MTLDIEVRSSGPGPRAAMEERSPSVWAPATVTALAGFMGMTWTRIDTDHRGRMKRCADGVAIIIRRSAPERT